MSASEAADGRIPNDPCGAFCRENHLALEPTGSGPLDGLTFAVKDVMTLAGHRTAFGQPTWYRTHAPGATTALAVRRLLAAGARLAGITLTDELSYSLSGENAHYGTPVNPNAPGRVAGGSSSGSAAAVAAGLVDFALGTDCAGSVRLPASYCGIYGVRPTHARVPTEGVFPFAPSFDALGWFARDPGVLERAGRVLLDPAPAPPAPRRLLIAADGFALVEERIREALAAPVGRLKRLFGEVEEIVVCPGDLREWMECFRIVQAAEIWGNFGAWVTEHRPQFGPGIGDRFEIASKVTREEVVRELEHRRKIVARIEEVVCPGDVLCLPTSPRIAPLKNTATDTMEVTYRYQAMCLLGIAGHGGLPQVSLPLATLDGCPLGLSIAAARGGDTMLLELARRLA